MCINNKENNNRKLHNFIALLAFLLLILSVAMPLKSAEAAAKITSKTISGISSTYNPAANSFSSSTPKVVSFWDYKNMYNVASYDTYKKSLTITRYSEKLVKKSSIVLKNPYSKFGNVICDNKGFYYVLWAADDDNNKNKIVTSLVKYSYKGKAVGRMNMRGYECNPWAEVENSCWGTQLTFWFGSCQLAINENVLSCTYARKMYNGHQSNFVFYADINSMKRIYNDKSKPYTSHSFDQEVIGTSDGGFLFANHGDAYSRGFDIDKVIDGQIVSQVTSFHFREGVNRDHGYNETYAQLGGLCETDNAYVLCASSERTLSLSVAPANRGYNKHYDARDLFIQILKKDFSDYTGKAMYYTQGKTRKATGKRTNNALTSLYLLGNEVDYGVIWLTKLDNSKYVCNPKIVAMGNGKFAVLWQELSYSGNEGDAYYTVLNEKGKVLVKKTRLKGISLPGFTDVTLHKGKLYWTSSDSKGMYIHCLKP